MEISALIELIGRYKADRIVKLVSAVTLLLVVMLALSACATPHYTGRKSPPFPCKSYRCIGQGRYPGNDVDRIDWRFGKGQ